MADRRLRFALLAAVIAITAAIAVPASASAAATPAPTTTTRDHGCLVPVIFGFCAVQKPHLPASTISGNPQEGSALTCANDVLSIPVIGGLINALPKTWHFQRSGLSTVSGSSSSYNLGEGDIGRTVSCSFQIGGTIDMPGPLPLLAISLNSNPTGPV